MARASKLYPAIGAMLAGVASAVPASAQQAPRSTVPIREVVIAGAGSVRYAIEVVVNGVPILTGFDTGSTGLRLLPRAAARAQVAQSDVEETYSYGSGVKLEGKRALVGLSIGAARGRVIVQAVNHVGCVAKQPDCPASHLAPSSYGLMGSGQPGQGFTAIIGTRLEIGRIANPFPGLGVHRWIVHLPQRGRGTGTLVLNPDARDTAGFIPLTASGRGTVRGCLALALSGARSLCGPTLLDTGAPGLSVLGAERPPAWRPDRRARIGFAPTQPRPAPAIGFVTGDRDHGATANFKPQAGNQVVIHAGTLPFYAYDVLFDADANTIALRPNPDAGPATVPLAQ
jgi:hypothetical protein